MLAGWVALLAGCVEYDTGQRQAAETTRQAALSLGTESDQPLVPTGWKLASRPLIPLAGVSWLVCQYGGMGDVRVRRVDFGYFVRPAEETGTGRPRVEPCLGYVVDHPRGMLLFDTGMGSHPEADTHYRPHRAGLREALATVGAQVSDLSVAANCHLHFDHCGGNPLLGPIPVYVQGAELDAARRTAGYTLPELIEGNRFESVTGEVEVLPGVFIMPTPGHTDGHQSLIVRRSDGAVILAGQSHDTATQYAADQLAWRARRDRHGQPLPDIPDWIDALQQLDPRIVYFAHDRSVWTP